ncbi:MAG: hypothetical protein EAZ76_15950 [Nostocales cyanobacterium]|nr:MAG: hypothetical protein EAZ87_23005 [Nostocales cyanobacterium]TAF09859.1 MAG: hypothetical protein EAZ76_15950 [Nostocales cyanobacterium]
MSLLDCTLLTVFNTAACLTFPKILSIVLANQKQASVRIEEKINTKIQISAPEPKQEAVSLS